MDDPDLTHSDDEYEPEEAEPTGPTRAGPGMLLAIGLVVGLVAGLVVALITGWRPLTDANEVRYEEIVVGLISPDGDQICWPRERDRRDADLQCAILAIDPRLEMPQTGDEITIGVARLETADGSELQQVVWVSQPPAREDIEPTPGG